MEKAKRRKRIWERLTGLKGDCFVAYALWEELTKKHLELKES